MKFNKFKCQKLYLQKAHGATPATLANTMVDMTHATAASNVVGLLNSTISSLGSLTATVSELKILDGVTATKSELNIMASVTATTAELNLLASLTATASELDVLDGVTATTAEMNRLTGVTATTEEMTNAADVSGRTVTYATGGAKTIAAGIQTIEYNHSSTITGTIANANAHQGLFICKQRGGAGDCSHSLVLTLGTFDGTNATATFNAAKDALTVYFDSNGAGTIIENVGAVALS